MLEGGTGTIAAKSGAGVGAGGDKQRHVEWRKRCAHRARRRLSVQARGNPEATSLLAGEA